MRTSWVLAKKTSLRNGGQMRYCRWPPHLRLIEATALSLYSLQPYCIAAPRIHREGVEATPLSEYGLVFVLCNTYFMRISDRVCLDTTQLLTTYISVINPGTAHQKQPLWRLRHSSG